MQKEKYKIKDNLYLIRQFLPYLSQFKKSFIFVFLTIPFVSFFFALQPFLFKHAIDSLSKYNFTLELFNNIYTISWLPFILIACALIVTSISIIHNFIIFHIGQLFVTDIRAKLFYHFQKLPVKFFDKNHTGKLLTRLTDDLEALSESLASGLLGTVNDLFNIVAILIFMFVLSPELTGVELLLISLVFLLLKTFQVLYRETSQETREYLSIINSLFQESLRGVLSIKILNAKEQFARYIQKQNNNYQKANYKYIAIDASFSALIEFMGVFAIISILSYILITHHNISMGSLVAFVGYSQMLFYPIQSLSEKFGIFQSCFNSLERVQSILEEEPADKDINKLNTLAKINNIKIKNINFKYKQDSDLVLKDINLDINKGDSIGIIGRTGSGKSTLAKLLCKFYNYNTGEIIFNNNISLSDISPSDIRQNILFIPQRDFLFSGTVKENLVLDKSLSDEEIINICKNTGLWKIIETLPDKLNTELRQDSLNLSHGQRQLMALTRALIQDTEILILDEATANIDRETEELIIKTTEEILNSGKTVIFIAHRLNLVQNCDNIIVMSEGEIIESGTHSELISQTNSHYNYLWSLDK